MQRGKHALSGSRRQGHRVRSGGMFPPSRGRVSASAEPLPDFLQPLANPRFFGRCRRLRISESGAGVITSSLLQVDSGKGVEDMRSQGAGLFQDVCDERLCLVQSFVESQVCHRQIILGPGVFRGEGQSLAIVGFRFRKGPVGV